MTDDIEQLNTKADQALLHAMVDLKGGIIKSGLIATGMLKVLPDGHASREGWEDVFQTMVDLESKLSELATREIERRRTANTTTVAM
jgi:hypothetical protein